jgi:hypothetical protein
MATPTQPKPPTDWPKAFRDWAAGRTGLTIAEMIDVFASGHNLTPDERKSLHGILKEPAPKPKPPEPPKPKTETPIKPTGPEKEQIITRTRYPKWWKDSLNATINLTAPQSQVLATVTGKLRLYVATIVITVTGETIITIGFGNAGSSGPIFLGGTDQPMGIVIAMGNSPAPCGSAPLTITATDPTLVNPSIGGWATCFVEEN